MAKKKRSSASRRKQPPPSTTIDETFTPPTPAVEPVDPVDPVKREISRALIALRSGKHEKALDFIKESISCHPLSGYLHHVEGMVHQSLADKVEEYCDARFKQHLEDGVFSSQLAVELLPNSIHCASLLAELLYQLAFLNDEWGRVIEVCKGALKIENPTDSGIGEIFGEDVCNESRTEDEKLTVMMWLLRHAEQKSLEFAEKKAVEDSEVDINHVVMAMDRRKKQFKAVVKVCCALKKKMIDNSKKFNCDDERIVEYKRFWSGSLGNEKKKGFQKVNIEELEKHLKLLKCKLAVDHLSEAIAFAKDNQTLKFWDCYDCVKKFGDYASYRHHFGEKHRMVTTWKLASELDIGKKSVDMVLNCVWKPVDTAEARKIIVNHTKSELCSTFDRELGSKKGLDECKSSTVGKVLGKISKSDRNASSRTSADDPKWAFCDDTERAEILLRIRGIFDLLLKNNCLAKSHVHWAIEYTKDQFESTIPLSQFRNRGLETPQIICCLGASQLTEVLEFLRDMARNCGLSEDAEMDNPMDDKLSGDLFVERIDFSKDYSCLLWQELQGEPDDNNFDAVDDDGSAIILPLEYENHVFSNSYDIVSWLHVGSSFGEAFKSWTCLRDFQRGQAKKLLKMFDEELLHLHTLYDRRIKLSSKLKAVQMVGSMLVEEISKMEKSPEDQTQHFLDLLKKRLEETQEIDDISVATKVEVITNVLEDAQVVMSGDQSGSEECSVEDEWKQAENAVKIVSQRLKMQLLNDLSLLDAIVLRIIGALRQYEWDLASISVYDYRSIIVPMMKSFLQPLLKDLYKDAEKESKAAGETLLAVMALEETEKKINKDSDNVKQKKDKKKKKKKNKNPKKAKESDGTNDSKHFELHQKGAEQDDNPNSKSNDSLGELKQLTVSDEERMLAKYLENQKQFEHEACVKVNASGSRHEKLLGDSVSVDDVSENLSAIEESMLEEPSEYQKQIDNNETKQKCIAEKPKNIGETIGGNTEEGVSDFSPERLLGDSVSVDVSENSSAIEERMLEEPFEYQRQIDNEAKQKCIAEKPKNIGETIGGNAVEGVSNFFPERLLGDSVSVDVSENLSAIKERMLEEPSEYQRQIDNEAIRNCNAEKLKNIGETIGGNTEEGVSYYSSESNHEECEKRFLCDIEKAICLSLDCFEKRYGTLLPTDVNNGKTSRLDVQLYVIMQSQWYLRQIRDEFMSIVPNKTHTHAGDPCFRCAYSDTFAARRIASRDMPEEVVQLSSGELYPVQDYFEEWLSNENPANKVIDISSSACQLKQQLVDVVRKIVVDLEHERQINNDDTEKDFAEQNTA